MPNRVQYKNQTVLKVLRYSGDIQFRSWGGAFKTYGTTWLFSTDTEYYTICKNGLFTVFGAVQYPHVSFQIHLLSILHQKLIHAHLRFTNPI